MAVKTLTPDFRDEVRNKLSGVSGIVDAVYTKNGVKYLDVCVGDRMYYEMLASNWEVVEKYIP
jgi:hypothetical protein